MRRACLFLCLAILSGTFAYAGTLKAIDPRAFQESILDFQILGLVPAALLAWWLPWFEMTCAVAVWIPRTRLAAFLCITAMLIGFLGVITAGLLRGLSISCGCFGAGGHDLWIALAIDLGLLITCLIVWMSMAPLQADPRSASIMDGDRG